MVHFDRRSRLQSAVNHVGAELYEARAASTFHGFDDVDRTPVVDRIEVLVPIPSSYDRVEHACSQAVHDVIRTDGDAGDRSGVRDVDAQERRPLVDRWIAVLQVTDLHLLAAVEQVARNLAADEAIAAEDDVFHRFNR